MGLGLTRIALDRLAKHVLGFQPRAATIVEIAQVVIVLPAFGGQLDGLAREGLISKRYATRTAKFWSSKSVGPNNKMEGKTLTETVFVDYQEQHSQVSGDADEEAVNPSELLRGSNGNDVCGLKWEPVDLVEGRLSLVRTLHRIIDVQ